MDVFTESQRAAINKVASRLINTINECTIKVSSIVVGNIEKYNIKQSIRELEKSKLVSSPSTVEGMSVKRFAEYENSFAKYTDKMTDRCWVFYKLDKEKQEERYNLYYKELIDLTTDYQKEMKKIYEKYMARCKKINISKETVKELKIEVESFSYNIHNLSGIATDAIEWIQTHTIDKSDSQKVIQLSQIACNKIAIVAQRLLTDYIVYPNHLIQTFKSLNHIENKGS